MSNGGDVQDWAAGQTSSFNAFVAPGQAGGIDALDVTVMNTLGWETAVPEPATVALMLAGLASLAAGRHRRSRRA